LVSALNAGRFGVDGLVLSHFKEKLFINKTKEIKDVA
ncbi:Crp/Fnr family transcriptional regulator, partial [Priestia megaterium]